MESTQAMAGIVEAETPVTIGCVRLIRSFWEEPIDLSGATPQHHLELALLPRSNSSLGCFPEWWDPNRFEPIGEVFLIPANQIVHAKSDCRHQHSVVCSLNPHATEDWIEHEIEWTDRRLMGSLDIASPNIRNQLFRMGEEIRAPGFASETILELMSVQIAIELSRYLMGFEEEQSTGGLAPWRLRLIDERLVEDASPPTLHELAEICTMSVRHLTRAFRASRGRSIGQYILEHRMDFAKKQLAAGMCIKEVAHKMGFSAPTNFSVAFRRATGETPSQYKNRAKRRFVSGATVDGSVH